MTRTEAYTLINEMWRLAKSAAREIRVERGDSPHRERRRPWEKDVPWYLIEFRSYMSFRQEMLQNLLDSGNITD